MSSSYKQLIEQRTALDAQIAEARKNELASAIAQVRDMITEFGLTAEDVFPTRRNSASKGTTVAAKYRDPSTGATWTGRGKPPTWIKDQDREKFAI
jgi:DNA-binding protein H-NS